LRNKGFLMFNTENDSEIYLGKYEKEESNESSLERLENQDSRKSKHNPSKM